MKKLFIVLILVYIVFDIVQSFDDSMHKQFCYDYYRGRDVLFEKCMSE